MSIIINYISKSSIFFLFLFLLMGCNNNSISQKKKIENIKAFAKLYGYVRWFHPSDEAQQINWDKFACYGVKTVENAPNSEALRDSLLKLFLHIAPALEIYSSEKHNFDISKITPPDTQGFYPVYWQHSGVNLNKTPANFYKSIRVGRINKLDYNKTTPLGKSIPASRFSQTTVKLEVFVKSGNGGSGQLFFEGLNRNDYMNLSAALKPIYFKRSKWEQIVVERNVRPDDLNIFFGFNCLDTSGVFIDNIKLSGKNQNNGDSVVYENDFNNLNDNDLSEYLFDKNLPFDVQYINDQVGNNGYLFTRFNDKNFQFFEKKPEFGETIYKQVHSNIFVQLPVVLMGDENQTFPATDKESLRILQNKVIMQHVSGCLQNLGSLVIVWNVIQHFFPYFEEVDVDWEKEFTTALNEIYNGEDFEQVLRKFTAKLNDGHVNVLIPNYKNINQLPIKWEWIGENLVITEVYDQNSGLLPGTIVKKIANKKTKKYFSEMEPYIPAPTIGFVRKASENLSLQGTPGDSVRLDIIKTDGTKDIVCLKYSLHPLEHYKKSLNKTRYKILKDNIYYLNLDQISMTEIDSLMPDLVKCKGIICDLRGYPNNNHEILNNLLTLKDTVDHWMKIPQIVYPDRKSVEFAGHGWQMVPKQPQIKAPVVFITDGNAISYAESVLLIVKHYNLATIVGQPSAGTNGNINKLKLPNEFQLMFTGMKVTNGDGSQHFGVGVLPDVYVEKTIEGVRHNKDEFLIEAVEILKTKNL